MSSPDQNCQPNYYAIIPAYVRYCKNLEPAAKLFYGELTALANKEGYCWATNQYFSELYDVDERTITRWLSSLKENNFIHVDTKKVGMYWDRKIYILPFNQNNFSDVTKTSNTMGQKCSGRSDEKVHNSITLSNNTREQQQQEEPPPSSVVAAFYPCLKEIQITDDDRKVLMKFSEHRIRLAIEYISHPGFVIKKSLMATMVWHCQAVSPPTHEIEERAKISPQQKIAFEYNEKIKTHKVVYEENQKLIKENRMKLNLGGRLTSISLNNPVGEVKKDLDQSARELRL